MATRKFKSLDALRDAAMEPAPALPILNLADITVGALTVKEASVFTRLPYRWLHDRINEGRVRVISEGLREKVIPLVEIKRILDEWAAYDNTA